MNETMTKIQTVSLGSSQTSITFSNIPQTYTDLVVRLCVRTDRASSVNDYVALTFNSNTSNYSGIMIQGYGNSSASYTFASASAARYAGDVPSSSATGSAFGSTQITIPNYSSSNYKSYTVDAAVETNGSTNVLVSASGVWSATSPITSITFNPGVGTNFVANSEVTLYGVQSLFNVYGNSIKATGGTITTDGTYVYHTFNSTGAFQPNTRILADVLLLAGGGGGGTGTAGGGGAGGLYVSASAQLLPSSSYTCTVGAGGAANSNGNNTFFGPLTSAVGGGAGSGATGGTANSGGSGGGGGIGSGAGGPATANQGNAGGAGYSSSSGTTRGAGGGGGAGSVGGSGSSGVGGTGGSGTNAYSPWLQGAAMSSAYGYYIAAGGGGGSSAGISVFSNGGSSIGGNGSFFGSTDATAGVVLTGSGGGGGGTTSGVSNSNGAAGSSGFIIIRYKA